MWSVKKHGKTMWYHIRNKNSQLRSSIFFFVVLKTVYISNTIASRKFAGGKFFRELFLLYFGFYSSF